MADEPHGASESDSPPSARRWTRLEDDTCDARVAQRLVPDHPLVQIGRFESLAPIGEGGYGVVFKAHDPALDRPVAIKLYLAHNARAEQRLMREARLLAKLNHPNIVTVYELGRHLDDMFIAMEYVDGCSVSELARRDPRPAWQAIVDVYRGVGRGLAAAHELGIVHGDVKPSNILLDLGDLPRVADFGLAKLHEHMPATEHETAHVPSGTPAFMAPEVLRGQPSDAFADQWSFCVSLWETFTAEALFEGRSPAQVLKQIERRLAAKLEHPHVPEGVREILRVGLSIDPRERYPSMGALVDELDRLRAVAHTPAEGVELRPISEAPARTAKRGAIVFSLVVAGATIGWMGRPSVEGRQTVASVPLLAVESPCAGLESGDAVTADRVVRTACEMIRDGDFVEANEFWGREHGHRLSQNEARAWAEPEKAERLNYQLAAATLPIARTFLDQAEMLSRRRVKAMAAALVRGSMLMLVGPTDRNSARKLARELESRTIYVDMRTAAEMARMWAPEAAVGSFEPECDEIEQRAGLLLID